MVDVSRSGLPERYMRNPEQQDVRESLSRRNVEGAEAGEAVATVDVLATPEVAKAQQALSFLEDNARAIKLACRGIAPQDPDLAKAIEEARTRYSADSANQAAMFLAAMTFDSARRQLETALLRRDVSAVDRRTLEEMHARLMNFRRYAV